MEERNFIVYKHTSPSNKIYIGITCKDPKYRWRNGRGYENNRYFWNAIQKYGWNNFKHEILFTRLTEEEAKLMEQCYISLYDSANPKNGYNHTLGGDGTLGLTTFKGKHHNKESKLKISKSNKISWDNPNRKELQKIKMSDISKKLWKDPEYRKMQSQKSTNMWKNQNFREKIKKAHESPEFIEKKRKNSKKQWENQEFRIKMSEKMKKQNKKLWKDPEYRIKMSEKMKKQSSKQWEDPQYRKKMSENLKTLWENPEFKKMQSEKATKMLTELWKNTEYRNLMKEKNSKKIILLNTNMIFESITDASKFINTDRSNIVKACKGKIKYSGKINGEPARWMYYEDYLKLDDKEEII